MNRTITTSILLLAVIQPATHADEWVNLFDGKTLKGWKRIGLGKAEYVVKEGTIYGRTVEGSRNTFLATEKEYGDFELQFEVRVHDKLNSGVQIRSREKTAADVAEEMKRTGRKGNRNNGLRRFHGPQIEIEASPGEAGFVYGEATGRGWLSNNPVKNKLTHKKMKNGEWNHFRVVAKGNRIQTWINGEPVEDLSHDAIYKSHPKGKIGLQVHGIKMGTGPYDVAWRKIRIRELSAK